MSPLIVGVVRRGLRGEATSVTSRWRTDTSFAVACLILMLTTPVRAQAPDTVFLEELTWTELRTLVESGKTTIILPIGGTEQNGPHMALGKHNVRVKALSERIARALGNALVAPVIAYVPEGGLSPPTGHMRFPGTLTVPENAFRQTLESAARSVRLHGFRDVVLLGDHGSTQLMNLANQGDGKQPDFTRPVPVTHFYESH